MEAAVDERPEVAVFEIVRDDEVDARLFEFVNRNGNFETVDLRAVVETPDVVVEAKNRGSVLGLVAPDPFEHRGSVMKRVRENVNLRVREIHHPAVHPDLLYIFESHQKGSFVAVGRERRARRSIGGASFQSQPGARGAPRARKS